MSSTRQLRPWIHLEIRPCLRAKCRALTHGTSNIHRLSTYVQPSTTSNSHKHALHYQNSTYLCIASIYNTITNANIIYAASPTATSPTTNNIYNNTTNSIAYITITNNKTFSTADLFTSTRAQDIPTCFPRRDTIALFCLSTIPLASESPVSPFYDTQHLFTQQKAHYFSRLWLFLFPSYFFFCRFFCSGHRFFSFGGTFTGRGRYISEWGQKCSHIFFEVLLESIFLFSLNSHFYLPHGY